jgi:mRNA-degrading endonuclease RelE of RelBE toxin-antitoxin system
MVIIETTFFTRQIQRLLSDDEYRQLQSDLVNHPEKGEIIQGSGGLRKTRWSVQGRGKRGGIRVIYYWVVKQDQILMLMAYAKNEQENLTPEQVKILRQIVESEYP